jgi:putative DNA primase/helicase
VTNIRRLPVEPSDRPPPTPPKATLRAKANGAADEANGNAPATNDTVPIIRVIAGDLPRMVDEAQSALMNSGLPIFARGGVLVHPIEEDMPAADGRKTIAVRLRTVAPDLLTRWLAEAAKFVRYDMRRKKWIATDPPRQVTTTILAGEDRWPFPRVACVVTNPVLRIDGSLLAEAGYDATTQLYMVPDPHLRLPALIERPSRDEAVGALGLLEKLLAGFKFASEIDRSVALSLLLTVVTRASVRVAPLHLVRANIAGTGKSFLADLATTISMGRECPVTTSTGRVEEDEKKLCAILRAGVPVISLDNCSYDLTGDMLCQIAERPLVRIRILGLSEIPEFECKTAIIATGNNVGPKGDMNRRTLTCNLVADVERPELRKFAFDPLKQVLADRGTYLGAIFTIIRAYQTAGSPPCRPFGSYPEWTAMVRAPLIWLGKPDPVDSMEMTREEDPEMSDIDELFGQWRDRLGTTGTFTALQIRDIAHDHPPLQDLLMRVAGDRSGVSTKKLGAWLRRIQGKIMGGYRLMLRPGRAGGHAPSFFLQIALTTED